MTVEFLHNGRAFGSMTSRLLDNDMNINALRLYKGAGGYTYMDRNVQNNDGTFVFNEDGTPVMEAVRVNHDSVLPFEAWRLFDEAVETEARPQMRIIADLTAAGLTRTVDAMSLTTLSYTTVTESGSARVVMDPAVHAERDRPLYGLRNTPIPFIESEWQFNLRDLNISRRGGQPLDLTQIRTATRVVMETAEDIVLGVNSALEFNGIPMPGILNYDLALPKVLTAPTALGWTPETLYNQINEMRQLSIDNNFPGPWVLYFASGWDIYLNKKYSVAYQSGTLRNEILQLDGISGIRTLRRLPGFRVILMQMTSNVFQLINGMPLRAIQWEGPGGWIVYGKVITSITPQPRSDAAEQTGIVVGATP